MTPKYKKNISMFKRQRNDNRNRRLMISRSFNFSNMTYQSIIATTLFIMLVAANDAMSFARPSTQQRHYSNKKSTSTFVHDIIRRRRFTEQRKHWSISEVSRLPHRPSLFSTMSSDPSKVKDDQKSSWNPVAGKMLPFITPYQVLHPDSFPLPSTYDTAQQLSFGGYDRVMSLNSVISLMKQCLMRIAATDTSDEAELGDIEHILNHASSIGRPSTQHDANEKILRIEHQIFYAATDPLAWIRQQHNNVEDDEPLFYFCTQENDKEVAVVGSAIIVNRTDDLWERYYLESDNGALPTNVQWYGGARFDTNSPQSEHNNEWSDFGPATWILPATELMLRKAPLIIKSSSVENNEASQTLIATFAIHLVAVKGTNYSWSNAAKKLLRLLECLDAEYASKVPPTTLPPILERGNIGRNQDLSTTSDTRMGYQKDQQELFEEAVAQAMKRLQPKRLVVDIDSFKVQNSTVFSNETSISESPSTETLEKVVLARQQQIHFGTAFTALDLIRRWKYGGHEGGHLFYLRPKGEITTRSPEFFGCTPERLFSVKGDSGMVKSEALAGTRPRGSTQKEDDKLLRDLYESPKDRRENRLTGSYIEKVFHELYEDGLISKWDGNISHPSTKDSVVVDDGTFVERSDSSGFFVRRLLHLQHLCRRYSATIINHENVMKVAHALLFNLNPTPAVCGVPMEAALNFIREYESIGFDRGFYSGPIGCIGYRETDILVALRCGLASSTIEGTTAVLSYAGAGLVYGSTLQGEWAETNYKFSVISSLFPQSPMSLHGSPTANVAWSTAFVTELIRNGVTRFYVCPGSRSSPLVAAIAKAVRSNVGVVHAISVHDERSAGFRAVGYARGSGKLAAVLTSSGTAVANLYPAIVEAGMDGLPLLLLTADRPYESRGIGANQAIDQVKTFSDTYVRWFRDVLPPSDDVPVSIGLSDAGHAVHLARELRGPVHINIQFRENLAPDAGPIRGDYRTNSLTRFNGHRFTDVPGYDQWSAVGKAWSQSYARSIKYGCRNAILDVANLIVHSKRGIIVVGNLRPAVEGFSDQVTIEQSIIDFALAVGFPIFAGVQGANIRFKCSAVVPFAEHLLKCSLVAQNFQPDLIIQIGAPLISTAVPDALLKASKRSKSMPFILLHPHTPQERVDASMLVTHSISAEISPFLQGVLDKLKSRDLFKKCSSQLAPLVLLGRMLRTEMKEIVFKASRQVLTANECDNGSSLSEPQLVIALSEFLSTQTLDRSLFLSNSMPIRDAETFLYPYHDLSVSMVQCGQVRIGSNRGASGIDGIISSALGYSESTMSPTTLLIGDVAALHDIGSLHSVSNSDYQLGQPTNKKRHPLTSIIVNNDGGSIFSFLPIAQHGSEVGFEEFFATPTRSFAFDIGATAFGLSCNIANSYELFCKSYNKTLDSRRDSVIEARVLKRSDNVKVHQKIASEVESYVSRLLGTVTNEDSAGCLPLKVYGNDAVPSENCEEIQTMVLLHGWMGDKLEWHETAKLMEEKLGRSWRIFSVDLPGHGDSPFLKSSDLQQVKSALQLFDSGDDGSNPKLPNIETLAQAVLNTLAAQKDVRKLHAIVGYSLGGRVALEMKNQGDTHNLISEETSMILIGTFPGDLPQNGLPSHFSDRTKNLDRLRNDEILAEAITSLHQKVYLCSSNTEQKLLMDMFLRRWYRQAIWTGLASKKEKYQEMIHKRSKHLIRRGRDIALVLSGCSPPRSGPIEWKLSSPINTLFIAGELDLKYTNIGKLLQSLNLSQYGEISNASHALLVESSPEVAEMVTSFILKNRSFVPKKEALSVRSDIPEASIASNTAEPNLVQTNLVQTKYDNPLWATNVDGNTVIDSVEFETFTLQLTEEDSNTPVFGYGWGKDAVVDPSNTVSKRQGLILQLTCYDGLMHGLGEISPLKGLHNETFEDALAQILGLQNAVRDMKVGHLPDFNAKRILALDGSLGTMVDRLAHSVNIKRFLPSVRSGLEMALISLAAQQVSFPIHQALAIYTATSENSKSGSNLLPLSGFISRKLPTPLSYTKSLPSRSPWSFKSIKVKVGHQDMEQDRMAALQGFRLLERHFSSRIDGRIRADANRAWNASQVISFVTALEGLDVNAINKIEYIEEPLQKVRTSGWNLEMQVVALERSFLQTSIPYAIDESLVDTIQMCDEDFDSIKELLQNIFMDSSRGCAAVILKPTLLGYELSFRLAQYVRTKLGISAVLSSSFDSGLGLAHTAFLSSVVDKIGNAVTYPHGIGTFTLLAGDTITPSFGSYVNEVGLLNVPSLSRALFGLRLEEIRDSSSFGRPTQRRSSFIMPSFPVNSETAGEDRVMYEASTATSSSGNEISVAVSLPLPFSDEVAWLRFTDLPSMSRWSPWIASVRYQGMEETEWVINVRGISLKWRATSHLINEPFKGIQWQSVSGLRNSGIVEFIPNDIGSGDTPTCTMNVRMTITPPQLFRPFLQGNLFLEDFLRDRLLKWSLEMFRDVVKADLALERGDVELGDALISSVEGKANAIEATLSQQSLLAQQQPPSTATTTSNSLVDINDGNDDAFE